MFCTCLWLEELGRSVEGMEVMSCCDEPTGYHCAVGIACGRTVVPDPEELDELSKLVDNAGPLATGDKSGLLAYSVACVVALNW